MASKEAVAKALKMCAAAFSHSPDPVLPDVWLAAFEDMSDDQLKAATVKAIMQDEFFPKVARIRELSGAADIAKPDVAGILNRIRGLTTYHNGTEYMPSVERIREVCGDAIAQAYGYVGPNRMEGPVFGGSGTGVDIATREFADALADAQEAGQSVALPPMPETKRLSNASQSVFVDGQPQRIGAPLAGLLAKVTPNA